MARFLADENFNRYILEGLLRRRPELNIVRVQDVNLRSTDDRVILEWAFQADRVLLTHDVSTMTEFVQERIVAGFNTAGVVVVIEYAPIGRAIDDLLSLIDRVDEWGNTFWFVPLTK
jgi:hypothetical protein